MYHTDILESVIITNSIYSKCFSRCGPKLNKYIFTIYVKDKNYISEGDEQCSQEVIPLITSVIMSNLNVHHLHFFQFECVF
jgi:hypothetical protein